MKFRVLFALRAPRTPLCAPIMKLDAMMADFIKNNVFGCVLAGDGDKLINLEDIDAVISAEIPDKATDRIAYKAVSQFMLHESCGEANPKCPCMSKGRCTKHYPKAFNNNTFVDADGYALYRRRDMGRTVECNKIHLDNRHVVPYHRSLFVKYQGHKC